MFLEHALGKAQRMRGLGPVGALSERRKRFQYESRRSQTAATAIGERNSPRGDTPGADRPGATPV